MIRSPLGLRIHPDPARDLREQLRDAARLDFKGVVLDAAGDLNPERLGESGRRDFRHQLRSVELGLFALNLPSRQGFDTLDQLEQRLSRMEQAFVLAYELGTRMVLLRVGAVPPEADSTRRAPLTTALSDLSKRADHHGLRLAIETGTEPGDVLKAYLDGLDMPVLGVSVDPGAWLSRGIDPISSTIALGDRVAHAYARDARGIGDSTATSPFGAGFAAGVLDWEAYLGSLEEIAYSGPLTLFPNPSRPIKPQIQEVLEIVRRF
jgi:L-ribulose-5-phosphate 3-epimerase